MLLNLRDRLETIFVDDVAAGFFWPFMTAAIAALFSAAPAVLLVRRLPGRRHPGAHGGVAAYGVRTPRWGSPPYATLAAPEAGRPTAAGRPPAAETPLQTVAELTISMLTFPPP